MPNVRSTLRVTAPGIASKKAGQPHPLYMEQRKDDEFRKSLTAYSCLTHLELGRRLVQRRIAGRTRIHARLCVLAVLVRKCRFGTLLS